MASAPTAFAIGVLCLGLATFLNASPLLETARRQPLDSPVRSVTVAAMESIATVSQWARIDLPREWLDSALGKGEPEPVPVASTTTSTTVTSATAATTTSATVSPTTSSPTESTTSTLPPRSVATPDDPMKLWIIGDSLVKVFGPELANLTFDTGVVEPEVYFRVVSGLVRPDYFDWPALIRRRMPELAPDVVVVLFGGNDDQTITRNGVGIEEHTPEWTEAYGDLVGDAMDLILDEGATHIYWVGLAIMRDREVNRSVIDMNSAYAAEAAERPAVTFVPAYDLFTDESGGYASYLRDYDGELRRMRSGDGAHFEPAGAYRLALQVLRYIAADWDLGVDLGPAITCPPSC